MRVHVTVAKETRAFWPCAFKEDEEFRGQRITRLFDILGVVSRQAAAHSGFAPRA